MSGNIIERAFELARSGECRTMSELGKRLRQEGFAQVEAHLTGRAIKAQMAALMAQARR